jgi:type VI secretion system protein ImpF
MPAKRLNPTLLHKVIALNFQQGQRREGAADDARRETVHYYDPVDVAQYNESALRLNVRRDLFLLLNTSNLEASVDLTPYPRIRTSVLNYGVADLTGKASSRQVVQQRVQRIREALATFEPRVHPKRLSVEVRENTERENALTFEINCEILTAVEPLPVRFVTDIEVDTGATTVRD